MSISCLKSTHKSNFSLGTHSSRVGKGFEQTPRLWLADLIKNISSQFQGKVTPQTIDFRLVLWLSSLPCLRRRRSARQFVSRASIPALGTKERTNDDSPGGGVSGWMEDDGHNGIRNQRVNFRELKGGRGAGEPRKGLEIGN